MRLLFPSTLQKRVFLTLLGVFFTPFLLVLMFQKVLPYRFGGILYIITRLLLDIQTLVFGPTFFAYTTFGPDPRGFMGWMLVIIFYSAIAFLFSWVGSMVMLRFQKHNQVL